jgi:hypothetical protein
VTSLPMGDLITCGEGGIRTHGGSKQRRKLVLVPRKSEKMVSQYNVRHPEQLEILKGAKSAEREVSHLFAETPEN